MKKGRRDIMGNFARAAALGAVAVATKDRAALADEEVAEDAPAPPSKADIVKGNIAKAAIVPVAAVGWALTNIFAGQDGIGPLDQLAFMSAEKERKQAKAGKKR